VEEVKLQLYRRGNLTVAERRLHKRYELPLKVAVETASDNRNRIEDTRLIDIGPGGACFGLKADVETGEILALTIPDINDGFTRAIGLPSRGEGPLNITLQGEVLRSERISAETDERRVAVRFIGPVRLAFGPETRGGGNPRDTALHEHRSGGLASEELGGSRREMDEGNGRRK
jgi:hypothetical protein